MFGAFQRFKELVGAGTVFEEIARRNTVQARPVVWVPRRKISPYLRRIAAADSFS